MAEIRGDDYRHTELRGLGKDRDELTAEEQSATFLLRSARTIPLGRSKSDRVNYQVASNSW